MRPGLGPRARDVTAVGVSLSLLASSLYFFNNSVELMAGPEPRVAASLLSALIGVSLLSASITLLRTWIVARALERRESEEG